MKIYHPSSNCFTVSPPSSETMKQSAISRNSDCNTSETTKLKALAERVLQRRCNETPTETKTETEHNNFVSLNDASETPQVHTNSSLDEPVSPFHSLGMKHETQCDYRDKYEERVAIHQYDGNLPEQDAIRLAYQSTLVGYLQDLHPEIIAAYEACIYQPKMN